MKSISFGHSVKVFSCLCVSILKQKF